jgi:hypothetical protein
MSEDDADATPEPKLEDLIDAGLAGRSWGQLDELAGEVTERLLDRAEAYWKARTNDIFVRNHPELVQQLAQVDATNLQTVVLARQLAALKDALDER